MENIPRRIQNLMDPLKFYSGIVRDCVAVYCIRSEGFSLGIKVLGDLKPNIEKIIKIKHQENLYQKYEIYFDSLGLVMDLIIDLFQRNAGRTPSNSFCILEWDFTATKDAKDLMNNGLDFSECFINILFPLIEKIASHPANQAECIMFIIETTKCTYSYF